MSIISNVKMRTKLLMGFGIILFLTMEIQILPTGGGEEARALLRSGLHISRKKRR